MIAITMPITNDNATATTDLMTAPFYNSTTYNFQYGIRLLPSLPNTSRSEHSSNNIPVEKTLYSEYIACIALLLLLAITLKKVCCSSTKALSSSGRTNSDTFSVLTDSLPAKQIIRIDQ